jgi:hypothetical protein
MEFSFTPEQSATIIVVIMLALKGVVGEISKRKGPERGCLYGDDSHDEIKRGLDTLSKEHEEYHKIILWIKTYLEVKNND